MEETKDYAMHKVNLLGYASSKNIIRNADSFRREEAEKEETMRKGKETTSKAKNENCMRNRGRKIEMNEKEKMVYDILLTPIVCDKKIPEIIMKDGVIRSPQRYCRMKDADMSDLSIRFYEIVYKDILSDIGGEILNEAGYPVHEDFMGDTMHSFNPLANVILGDPSKKHRSPIETWPVELVEYHSKYHCLANFWIIPMRHGRCAAKLSKYDSVNYYLNTVKDKHINDKEGYFGKFKSMENFLASHCISGHVCESNPLDMYNSKDKKRCINELTRIHEFWKLRAQELVNKYGDELYEYFHELGLI